MSDVHLIYHGALAELRLDNPAKLNAFTPDMLARLEQHCMALDQDPGIRAVVLTAAPAKAFCAGADIAAWSGLPPATFARAWVRDGHRIFDRFARLSKPTVAAITANAFGGGLELVACCDLRVIAPDATLALPETSIGVVPGWSGTQRLTRLMGEAPVKEMALFGRRLSAERSLSLGFVAEIAEDAHAAAFAIADRLTANGPIATEVGKYMIHAAVGEDSAALIEALGGGMIAATADLAEGVAAFKDKRKPTFLGT
ncbi:MAG: enoyl-CoA hydratase/isomerase family protein [Pseudomonadota bacterium]